MNKRNILKKVGIIILVLILSNFSCKVHATNDFDVIKNDSTKKILDVEKPIEVISECITNEMPEINAKSQSILKIFEKDDLQVQDIKKVEKIYDTILDRETTRIKTENIELDIDINGDVVRYKNFEDYSVIDKDKKDYDENEINTNNVSANYQILQKSDLNNIIYSIEKDLNDYILVDCNNNIDGVWVLTWCRNYENNLINPYDCVNIIVDAKDGSVKLYGKNKMEPNTTTPIITQEQAISYAEPTMAKYEVRNDCDIEVKLSFFRPNYRWSEEELLENENYVRLSWSIDIDECLNIQVDAVTGENIGGDITKATDCARAMGVVPFTNQEELTGLASQALARLGYNQSNYPAVTWAVSQNDMDWMLSRPDVYGLYLACHGDTNGELSVLTDNLEANKVTWSIWSNKSYGNWHFVFLDACYTSANKNFSNAFGINGSGRCFVGWNIMVHNLVSTDFDRRFLPKLGNMSVYDAVVESLWESRNAGYNYGILVCDPGFIGDSNYWGWAW